jgi:transcriptional regulator with XRE-family HTH domain
MARFPSALDRRIGRNLRAYRLRQRLSQTNLAAMMGVSYQQVQKYECGANRIAASQLHRICTKLGVPLDAMFSTRSPSRT